MVLVFQYPEHLAEMIINQEIDLVRLLNGDRPRRPRTVRNMSRDTVIRDAQHDLNVGRYCPCNEILDIAVS